MKCSSYFVHVPKLENLIIFIIREDSVARKIDAAIIDNIRQHFQILEIVDLNQQQKKSLISDTRGGDWYEFGKITLVNPDRAVICYDHDPKPVDPNDQLSKNYSEVKNANVFLKRTIRKAAKKLARKKMIRNRHKLVLLHASDNNLEAMVYLKAIFQDTINKAITRLEKLIIAP